MTNSKRAASIGFLHYGDTGNLGDFLCSPRHYFDFESDRTALIVGGGASNNFFCGRARKRDASVRIAWGIGQSWVLGAKPSSLDGLVKATLRWLTYDKASTRDPALASNRLPLVPCVSVFHPVTELPLGDETGIFLNSAEKVSGGLDERREYALAANSRAFVATNALPAAEFISALTRTRTIITNSYHAAYWGLLSGRDVHIIGYSSKFTNLAALFGFPESAVIGVSRGDPSGLDRAITECAEREPLRLATPDLTRAQFRKRNLDFARSLAAVGVTATLKSAQSATRDLGLASAPV
ncbi:hypothetical protein [Hyphomicrobium sp.]|uniref:hypothetical protein n=1 Tax=Hyphomicrobium sp. TaxID=82 RepID=UPI002E34C4C7|nr:hypothetical protein [Hyphomicrobium sp.]HEX2839799.1 hypothetical protein [Hyphomicrobium sp.]